MKPSTKQQPLASHHGVYHITLRSLWHPNTTGNRTWSFQVYLSCYGLEPFPLHKKEIRLPSPRGLSQLWMWIVLQATIDITQHAIIVAYALKSQFHNRNWSVVDYPLDKRLCHLCSYNVAENEAHFVLGYLLYNFFRERFPCIIQSIVLENLKSFFQSIYQVDISLYLT